MARCFDHGRTVLVQMAGDEVRMRVGAIQEARGVKLWFRKSDGYLERAEAKLPWMSWDRVTWQIFNPPEKLVAQARDVARDRGWL